ncbi:MAG: Calx-beta domain-containing protein [bacterium]
MRAISFTAIVSLFLACVTVWALTGITRKIIDERQARISEELSTNFADSPAFLVERLFEFQESCIQLFVPGMTKPVSFSAGLYSFNPKSFPESFTKGLVYEIKNGSPIYHLKVREVKETREIQVLDADGKVFYVFKPRSDYDPYWIAKKIHAEIYRKDCSEQKRDEIEAWLDPSHVEIDIALIPDSYIDIYAENAAASLWDFISQSTTSSLSKSMSSGGMSMMRLPAADTNIVISEISLVTSGKLVRVDYPSSFSYPLEMFASSNLMTHSWTILNTNLVTAGTNSLWWVDTSATNGADIPVRFYAVGSTEDTDGDGINDGRETLIYRSNPDAMDSDSDGLVDGNSGIVTTNVYPTGITTNGSPYVLGELSLGTDANKFDTDDDGCGDGWEIAHGHNPLDPNDPANVLGTITYSGRQTGTVWVIAVTSSNSWSTAHSYTSAVCNFPMAYRISDLEQTNYWLKSWIDTNGNSTNNAAEAQAILTNLSIIITNRLAGQAINLTDPDLDSDGLADWWEIQYFGSTTNTSSNVDSDGDEYTNQEEYDVNTNPTNSLSHPWNIEGNVIYTGPQTGVFYVVACTNGVDWSWAHANIISNTGSFVITHLPPNTDYWIRAWRDSSGDNLPTIWEAWGSDSGNPIFLDDNHTGRNVTLVDPDNDGDSVSDWWEVFYGMDSTRGGADGLTAWLQFDENSGSNALDSSGNANNGTLYGFASNSWCSGLVSNALIFNGSNSYVEVADNANLKTESVAISLWIVPDHFYMSGSSAMFVSKRIPNGTTGYSLGYENGGLAFTICASGAKTLRYSCILTSDVPLHITGTYASGNHDLYVNGVSVATTNYVFGLALGGIEHSTNSLRIGATSGGAVTNVFSGMIDDIRISGGGWTINDVMAAYELGADADGDGLSAWREFQNHTSPTNSQDPPSVSGYVLYSGAQTGPIVILAATNATSWEKDMSVVRLAQGPYQIPNIPPSARWVKAFRDSNGNGSNDSWEATGTYTNSLLVITGRVTGINVTLTDPDTDGDGLPDYEEMKIVNANTNDNIEKVEHVLPSDDFDGDGVSNADEIRLGTDSTNPASKPPVVFFPSHDLTVMETASSTNIPVRIYPPSTNTIQVRLYMIGGTAVNGLNYSFTNQNIVFSPGQTNQLVSILILTNDLREPTKTVTLQLDQLIGSAVCIPNDSFTINILDAFGDSDGDGLPDAWEMRYFGNLTNNASGNADGDGLSNLQEYLIGANPTKSAVSDTNNVLRLQTITPMR